MPMASLSNQVVTQGSSGLKWELLERVLWDSSNRQQLGIGVTVFLLTITGVSVWCSYQFQDYRYLVFGTLPFTMLFWFPLVMAGKAARRGRWSDLERLVLIQSVCTFMCSSVLVVVTTIAACDGAYIFVWSGIVVIILLLVNWRFFNDGASLLRVHLALGMQRFE